MCHFITTALPRDAQIESVSSTAERYQLAWNSIENKKVISQLENGSSYFYTAQGMCDCGTEFGAKCFGVDNTVPDFSSDIKAFQRKGWSETKISKWLAEKEKNIQKNKRINSSIKPGQEIHRWIGFISEILNKKYTTNVSVLLHMYSGDLESERIMITSTIVTNLSKISEELFLKIEEDCLYQFSLHA